MKVQELLFDVSVVLGRAASALLHRGIQILPGRHPSTDGDKTIYLPDAMRKNLTGPEIDYVRYLVHHEQSHITYTDMRVFSQIVKLDPPQICEVCAQALEDIRIEGCAMLASVGAEETFRRGRGLAMAQWTKGFAEAGEGVTVHQCLVHLIFGGHVDEKLRHAATLSSAPTMLREIHEGIADLYPAIDALSSGFAKLGDVAYLVIQIAKRFKEAEITSNNDVNQPSDQPSDQPGEQPGDQPSQDVLDRMQAHYDCMHDDHGSPNGSNYELSGGIPEAGYESIEPDNDEDENNITRLSRQRPSTGLSLGNMNCFSTDWEKSRANLKWAAQTIGRFTQVINLLRGDSRSALSSPLDHGIRIYQPSVPAFLTGMTSRILRKKIKAPRNGTAVAFVVDDSSSMRGRRSKAAWKAASLLVCACDRAKFPVAILRFNTRWAVCKNFSTPMARCRDEFSFGGGGGTDVLPAFNAAVDMLLSRREHRKILFVLTDGHTETMTMKCSKARKSGIQVVPIMFGDSALGLTRPGGCWYRTGAVTIPDKAANSLPSELVNALAKHL
jgi:hypothetical protein